MRKKAQASAHRRAKPGAGFQAEAGLMGDTPRVEHAIDLLSIHLLTPMSPFGELRPRLTAPSR